MREIKYSEIINNQPTFNIGAIGHVASGKSTLTKSITGIKTQKHSSEQERNITINIGYANAKIYIDKEGNLHTAPSKKRFLLDNSGDEMKLIGHISFVDVPGHESFMSNMISGSAIMNGCVLVIASNENIPQVQTFEHFEAVKNVEIDDFIILQNKVDLIKEDENQDVYKKIKKFVKGSAAEESVIIPSTIQNDINKDEILKNIINICQTKNLSLLKNKINEDLRMIVIRSFDINRQYNPYDKLQGGVVGGSLISGHLKIGDYIEMRPGFIIGKKYRPIYSQVVSLKSDTKNLDYAVPGGLIGVCLDIDPSLSKNNGMVGQIVGHVGKLPPVYNLIAVNYNLIEREGLNSKFKKDETILININSTNINGKITKVKKSKNRLIIELSKPACIFDDQKIAIFKMISARWILFATSKFLDGKECEKDEVEEEIYEDLKVKNNLEDINIIDDLLLDSFDLNSYDSLLKNVKFKSNLISQIKLDPPIVKKVNRDSVYTNYKKFIKSLENDGLKYEQLFIKYIKDESSTTCDVSDSGLVMRGTFRNKNIQVIIINFLKKYRKCDSCGSYETKLIKSNRLLFKDCNSCKSSFCI